MILYAFFLLVVTNYGVSVVMAGNNNNFTKQECVVPFTDLGGKCLMVETLNTGTWYEMNNHCFNMHGRLAVLYDANLLYFLIKFINDNHLNTVDYWIGATDEEEEGKYKWVDGREVRMGAPYWGYHAGEYMEPTGGTDENCIMLMRHHYYGFTDDDCYTDRGGVCEQVDGTDTPSFSAHM